MGHEIKTTEGSKQEKYENLLPQIESLITGETDMTANMANTAAALKQTFGFLWVGFYNAANEKELVLGPFQGPVACTRIAFGRGVCGTAWRERRTITVADVDLFPGHIACNSASRSEIVVPLMHGNEVKAVLDIDSDTPCTFDETDATYLKHICDMLSAHAYGNNAL